MAKRQIAVLNESKCDQLPTCAAKRICPVGAITQAKGTGLLGFLKGGPVTIDVDKCVGCGKCVMVCPHRAISMIKR